MQLEKPKPGSYVTDYLTVIALSMLAYTLAVLLHEHLGHAVACVSLGGHTTELGAYYVDCQYGAMPDISIRLEAVAGPFVSLLLGISGLLVLGRIIKSSPQLRFGFWLLGTIGLLTATGYLLFSGVTGFGDFGTSRDGALYLAQPEWLWRVGAIVLGVAGYVAAIYFSLRRLGPLIGGEGNARVAHAQKLALTSYLSGSIMSVLVSLLNPHGIVIVLMSAVAATFGGTSALAWMAQMLNRKEPATAPPLQLPHSWPWIVTGFVVAVLFAVILGPTIHP
jgi:hypothetical protein